LRFTAIKTPAVTAACSDYPQYPALCWMFQNNTFWTRYKLSLHIASGKLTANFDTTIQYSN